MMHGMRCQTHPDTIASQPKCSGRGCFGLRLSNSRHISKITTQKSVSYGPSSQGKEDV